MVGKKDIEKLILQNKKSTLKNHWNDAFFYNTTKYSGEIKPNELLIWRSALFLRGVYPIFHLTFDQNEELKGIKTEKNPYHKLLNKISIGIFILLVLGLLITTEIKTAIIGIIGISIFYLNPKDIVSNKILLKIHGLKCEIFEKEFILKNDLNTKIYLEYGEAEYNSPKQLSEMYRKLNIKPETTYCGTVD